MEENMAKNLDTMNSKHSITTNVFDIEFAIIYCTNLLLHLLWIFMIITIFLLKDILKIQYGIIKNLTKQVASILTEWSLTQVDLMTKSKLNRLSKVFSNSFHFCSTHSHLEKWLVQN